LNELDDPNDDDEASVRPADGPRQTNRRTWRGWPGFVALLIAVVIGSLIAAQLIFVLLFKTCCPDG
jgi:hypothetical protein